MNHHALTRFLAVALLTAASSAAMAQALPQINDPYFAVGRTTLAEKLKLTPNTKRAKNVILFVGDGMGISTVTAARILDGQLKGVDGESNRLAMEQLPYAALSKTYTHDAQVADSAPTATALVAGVKTINGVIGVNSETKLRDCASATGKDVMSLAGIAERAGLATGIVSTARITHATPAAMYAHTPHRDWEGDANMQAPDIAAGCKDIASQLVAWPHGDGLEVALGGGRDRFLPTTMADPEDAGRTGSRRDGRDLTKEWLSRYSNSGSYVWNKAQFDAIDAKTTPRLLGLFERSHMKYEADRAGDKGGEPSIAEMTTKAIDILSQNPNGFFLMVEGGRIDHGHHDGEAQRALLDAVAMDAALKVALAKVDLEETLVIVTADHSHVFSIAGYPERNNPILGIVQADGKPTLGSDGKAYTTLSYANGPGAVKMNADRPDPRNENTGALGYKQQALVPMESETHGGEDVAIFAAGPWAHLFQGVVEQQFVFHVMAHATGWVEKAGLRAEAK
ncbi:MAG: alkaline phosphatase [Stutzerimonas stutzeri]|uniref:Alkaline phosphatase n=1 Tax=Bosea eneae TaxID=151454 RepID=A0ABW0J050_9HYPH|nr:MAG: alkaline phosphatase [Stutzerimonas stutzeri]